jgi:S1-C subfamily serine protease
VKRIVPQLIEGGRVTDSGRAALRVGVTTVADADGQPAGVGIVSVAPGGPAAAAGIRAGDVVVRVAGQDTPSAGDLATVLAGQRVGSTAEVVVRRDGGETTVRVTLGDLQNP